MKTTVNYFNFCFGCLFVFMQFIIMTKMVTDGHFNSPFNNEKYISLGGNNFDYYLGYSLYTVRDLGHLENYEDIINLLRRFVTAGIPIILISLIWLVGVTIPKELWEDKDTIIIYSEKIFMFITTIISLYYTYYSFVYITKFWLE
jgi:hypothetical protein